MVLRNSPLAAPAVWARRDLTAPEAVARLIDFPPNYQPNGRLVACCFSYSVPG
jgi:hypothetical protein